MTSPASGIAIGTGANAAPSGTATATPTEPQAPTAVTPAPVDPPEATELPKNPWDDPKAAQAEIERLRKENGAARTNAKAQAAKEARDELTRSIGKALGFVADDEPVDPAKLTEQLTAEQANARQAKVELAVFRAAESANGDPSALLDSRTFLAKLADIDPADTAAVAAAIATAVAENPRLGKAPASRVPAPNPALGSSASGAPDLDAQIAEAQKKGDVMAVIRLQNQKLQPPQR